MISQRGLFAATAAGAGALLLATGPAAACSISDFSANAVAACDTSTGVPMAAVTVTDKDPSGTPADVSVLLRMASGLHGPAVGTVHIAHPTAAGVTRKILVQWRPGYQWYVQVTAGNLAGVDFDVLPVSPDTACALPAQPTTAPATPSRTPAPTATPTKAAPVSAAPSTTRPATPSPSDTPTTVLATTGGSDSKTIAVLASAFLLVGAGGLFVLRRRADTGRH
ncbi:LPXTG cell wall anchor domain-containing protein [Streptomyces sp. H39-S7]|uniref:LPXTG cell wall anchor domain-containing protein n=1 Tax=Streptomyces sp. H39-S7 TaxID=3004357 RepID=UPI0022AF489B|nr:LPXTG cell wall anchor domain-containing protein [Streptomyces sp. H39-S7]MCZ4124722.1 LPXTG cell wall anchor domain-containing protein [Streptomyces sp. H39-S7]